MSRDWFNKGDLVEITTRGTVGRVVRAHVVGGMYRVLVLDSGEEITLHASAMTLLSELARKIDPFAARMHARRAGTA